MPIEVRELVIKGVISAGDAGGNSTATASGGVPNPDELVKVCVEKVLEILKEKSER